MFNINNCEKDLKDYGKWLDSRETLESQIFDWKSWDEGSTPGVMEFYDCVLKLDISKDIKKGDVFKRITICNEQSWIQFESYNDNVILYELKITVGEKIEL